MTAQVVDAVENVEITDVPVIQFVTPLPGFPDRRRFVLVRLDEAGLLYSLTAVDAPQLRFLVAPPAPFFPEYSVDVDDDALAALGSPDADDLLVLLVINAGDEPGNASANLLAPIIVAQRSLRAVQLILGRTGMPVRAPLLVA
jgi:flagellar assembly factor FliW